MESFTHATPSAFEECKRLVHLGLMHTGLRIIPTLAPDVANTLMKLELSHQSLRSMQGLGQLPVGRTN